MCIYIYIYIHTWHSDTHARLTVLTFKQPGAVRRRPRNGAVGDARRGPRPEDDSSGCDYFVIVLVIVVKHIV